MPVPVKARRCASSTATWCRTSSSCMRCTRCCWRPVTPVARSTSKPRKPASSSVPSARSRKFAPTVRNDAHKLIEECMLAANVATAEFLKKHEIPALYRVHDGPPPERLEKLRAFLGELGLSLHKGKDGPSPQGLPGAAVADRRSPGLPPDPDRDAALVEPGGVQRRQQRPLRPELRGIHPLHLADPALPRPADPPCHPQRDPFAPGNPARQAGRRDEHSQGAHLPVRRGGPWSSWASSAR